MKKIVFGLQLDNKVPPIGMGEENIEYFCGPQQFTILLEKRFGIKPPDDQQVAIRTDVYRQHLASHLSEHPDAFFRHSFSADPFATAQTLLNLRDALKQAGWKGDDNDQVTFNAQIELPYVFKSRLGVKANLNIFKQDSTFQNTRTSIDLGYLFTYNTRAYLGYQATESSDIQNTNSSFISDFKNSFLSSPNTPQVPFLLFSLYYQSSILLVKFKNHDDKADENDIEVRLTGWGIRDRHETLNSLHWGPDGWLYGCQGFATPSKVRKPEGKGRLYRHKDPFPEDILEGDGVDINGGVWRYHPLKDKFEVVAHGFSNPWGIDFDAKGQLFISACVIPHMWHVIPGGIYHRQGGQHFNPYFYSDIRTIADHSHRSAHGGARVYQSDAFPAEHKGRIFMANIHEHAVLSDILQPKGSGFVAKHGDELLLANNAQWVGFSMEVGPDGGLYVLDWHDADICGKEVLNGETGRIFRIMPDKSLAQNFENRFADLNTFTDKQLVELQKSPSDWHARRARVILQHRAHKGKVDKNAVDALQAIYKQNVNADYRLRAMWTLNITNQFTSNELLAALSDKDEHIRAWAIQFLCEDKKPSNEAKEESLNKLERP